MSENRTSKIQIFRCLNFRHFSICCYLVGTQVSNVVIFLILQGLREHLLPWRGHVVGLGLGCRLLLRERPVQFFLGQFVVCSAKIAVLIVFVLYLVGGVNDWNPNLSSFCIGAAFSFQTLWISRHLLYLYSSTNQNAFGFRTDPLCLVVKPNNVWNPN